MYLYIFQYFNPNAVYWLRISRNVSMTFEARCSGVPWLRKHAATWSPWRIWWVWSFLESQASCASENNNFEDTMIYFSEYIDRYIDRYIHNRYIYIHNVGSYLQNFSDKAIWINPGIASLDPFRVIPPRFFTNLASMSPRAFLPLSHESWAMMLKVCRGKMSCICMYIDVYSTYIYIYIYLYILIYIYFASAKEAFNFGGTNFLIWYPCRFMVSLPSGICQMFVHWSSTGHLSITDLTGLLL